MKQRTERQWGVGHVGLIIAIVVILAVGAVGWFVWQRQNDTSKDTDSTLQDIVRNASCTYDDKDLCKFFASYKAQKYYTITSTSEAEGEKATTVMQVEGEDKYHSKISGPISYEVISIGKSSYTKSSNGTWYKQTITSSSSEEAQGDVKTDLAEPTSDQPASTEPVYKKLGKEKCGR